MHKKIRKVQMLEAVRVFRAFDACIDCGIRLVASNGEYVCPKCGLVKQMIDGAV